MSNLAGILAGIGGGLQTFGSGLSKLDEEKRARQAAIDDAVSEQANKEKLEKMRLDAQYGSNPETVRLLDEANTGTPSEPAADPVPSDNNIVGAIKGDHEKEALVAKINDGISKMIGGGSGAQPEAATPATTQPDGLDNIAAGLPPAMPKSGEAFDMNTRLPMDQAGQKAPPISIDTPASPEASAVPDLQAQLDDIERRYTQASGVAPTSPTDKNKQAKVLASLVEQRKQIERKISKASGDQTIGTYQKQIGLFPDVGPLGYDYKAKKEFIKTIQDPKIAEEAYRDLRDDLDKERSREAQIKAAKESRSVNPTANSRLFSTLETNLRQADFGNQPSTRAIGAAVNGNLRIHRVLDQVNKSLAGENDPTTGKPYVFTNQMLGGLQGDLAGLYQMAAPQLESMKSQNWQNLQSKISSIGQYITGKPSQAVGPDVLKKLSSVLYDMGDVNNDYLAAAEKSTESRMKAMYGALPEAKDAWEGQKAANQDYYVKRQASTVRTASGFTPEKQKRLEELRKKQAAGTLK